MLLRKVNLEQFWETPFSGFIYFSIFYFFRFLKENDRGHCLLFSVQSDSILSKGKFIRDFLPKVSENVSRLFSVQDDRLQLQDHLRSEHETENEEGLEYLIAGCLMNSEERQAIVNVVKVGRAPLYWFLLKKYLINRILGSGAR